jgi:protein-L-isoaspartate(D-aspartate) O-methyltransferase
MKEADALTASRRRARAWAWAGAPRWRHLPRRLAAAGRVVLAVAPALALALAGGASLAAEQRPYHGTGAVRKGVIHRSVRVGVIHRQARSPLPGRQARGFAAARQVPPPPPGFVVPGGPPPPRPLGPPLPPGAAGMPIMGGRDYYRVLRRDMVNLQLRQRGISQPEVLAAMDQVPRHLFLPERMRPEAYADRALQVGPNRTIYQPYVVALMTSLLDLKHGDTVLEVGTGTGYHAAVLSRIARRVYSIEIDPVAASQAEKALSVMGYHNVEVWAGDGYRGLPERAPFNAILLSAAAPRIPAPLIEQLRVGGKMVVPVGGGVQDLLVITKTPQGIEKRTVAPVRVSPMSGEVQDGH